jgi:hypothetical protein
MPQRMVSPIDVDKLGYVSGRFNAHPDMDWRLPWPPQTFSCEELSHRFR